MSRVVDFVDVICIHRLSLDVACFHPADNGVRWTAGYRLTWLDGSADQSEMGQCVSAMILSVFQ